MKRSQEWTEDSLRRAKDRPERERERVGDSLFETRHVDTVAARVKSRVARILWDGKVARKSREVFVK